jgi:hypothetical protein
MNGRQDRESFRSLVLIICILFFSGCVSTQIIPPKDRISQIHTIEVVAMEPPPLTVSGELSGLAGLSGAYGPGAGGLLIIYGVVVLAKEKDWLQSTPTSSEYYQSILAWDNVWVPTVILVDHAAEILRKNSNADIKLQSGFKDVPGIKNRSSTIFMENWYAPLRSWYNADVSVLENHAELKADAILEVGIINYEIMGEDLMLQVVVKLVDGKTGAVIGRSRNADVINLGSKKIAFSNNANIFKEKYSVLGNVLLEKTLRNLNMIP